MNTKASWKDIVGVVLLLAGVVMLGISVFLCFSGDIWYDELFTMGLAGQSLSELTAITAADVHPPFYYMIVKLFLGIFGAEGSGIEQVVIAKLVSVLPFLLCMLYAVTKIRKYFGMFSAGLYFFLLISMPQMAEYTVEIRMYGYAFFFVTAGMLHAYELTEISPNKRKRAFQWIILTLYALAACYTHYFACVAACMIYVYLLVEAWIGHCVKQRIGPLLLSGAVCASGYMPWLVTAVVSQVRTVKENYWIQPLSIRTLGGCVKFLFRPAMGQEMLSNAVAVILCLLYGLGFAVWIWRSVRIRGDWQERRKLVFSAGCIGVLAGIIVFGFLVSALVRPIFVYRYMLPAAGVFWLAFSIMLGEHLNSEQAVFENRVSGHMASEHMRSKLRTGKIAGTAVILFLLIVGIRNYRSFYGEEMWKRVHMQEVENALARIEPDDILLFNFDQMQAVASYYLGNDSWLWYGNPEPLICRMYPYNHSLVEGDFEDQAGIAKIQELLGTGRRVWFLGSGMAREEIIQKWEAEGINVYEESGMLLERYWFNIYSVKNTF